MRAGDIVTFRTNGELEVKRGIFMQGLLGSPFIAESNGCRYGMGMIDMIQVYSDEKKWTDTTK